MVYLKLKYISNLQIFIILLPLLYACACILDMMTITVFESFYYDILSQLYISLYTYLPPAVSFVPPLFCILCDRAVYFSLISLAVPRLRDISRFSGNEDNDYAWW